MRSTRNHKSARHASPDLNRFQPITHVARSKVDELVRRGATVIAVRSNVVTLARQGQTARIDAWGRVEWAN